MKGDVNTPMPIKPTNNNTKNIVVAVLRQTKPFKATDLSLPGVPSGTISSTLMHMVRARVLTHDEPVNGQRAGLYAIVKPLAVPDALRAISRSRSRDALRHRRRLFLRRSRRRSPVSLTQLGEALEKARLYDRLLAYLNLTHADVLEVLK